MQLKRHIPNLCFLTIASDWVYWKYKTALILKKDNLSAFSCNLFIVFHLSLLPENELQIVIAGPIKKYRLNISGTVVLYSIVLIICSVLNLFVHWWYQTYSFRQFIFI